jgi:hypothetical protein
MTAADNWSRISPTLTLDSTIFFKNKL